MTSLAGRLLISRPVLQDPNFDGTLTLLVEHSAEGAIGLILNRPTDLTVADAFPGWTDLAAAPGVIFGGGPVERNAMIVIGASRSERGGLPLGLHSVDLDSQPALVEAAGIDHLRIFAGCAGWGAGQLEGELANGAWWTAEATLDDVFSRDPSNLWAEVLKREGGEMAWFAHMPEDPSLN